MVRWLLDTNVVIYLLTRPEPREGAPPPPVDPHLDALYRALDAFIDRVTAAGDRLLLTPLVVLEAVATLQHATVFQLPAAEAAEKVLRLVQAPRAVSRVKRVQLYLDPAEHEALERKATEEGVSMSELLRRIVREHLGLGKPRGSRTEGLMRLVGIWEGDLSDVSERHDEYLARALRRETETRP